MVAILSSLFVIALGAILRFAVTASVGGVILPAAGFVLMIVGGLGLALSIYFKVHESAQGAPTSWR